MYSWATLVKKCVTKDFQISPNQESGHIASYYFVSITVRQISCLIGLDSSALLCWKFSNRFSCLVESKPVKQDVICTVYASPYNASDYCRFLALYYTRYARILRHSDWLLKIFATNQNTHNNFPLKIFSIQLAPWLPPQLSPSRADNNFEYNEWSYLKCFVFLEVSLARM